MTRGVKKKRKVIRFSDHFKLGKSQAELDFVDIPLNTDIPLFIDPQIIAIREDEFCVKCNNYIVNFFQGVIENIRTKNEKLARYKLEHLSEPNETHLGLSRKESQGKGVSGKQSSDIFKKLKGSKAVETGLLKDLSDSELVIEGISNDKISDITTKIIKRELIEYTTAQCEIYGIPTENIASGIFWDPASQTWKNEYVNLPIYKEKAIILVPKVLARYRLQYNHQSYYNRFVLEYLQGEHIDANTSLVQLLKNGSKKVYKKDLKAQEEYKLSKEFLYEFSSEHPEVLEKYTESLPKNVRAVTDEQIEEKHESPRKIDYDAIKEKLQGVVPGKKDADKYHNIIIGVLEAVFSPNLYSPTKEEFLHDGRKRIDITYVNGAKSGFFEYLSNHIHCPLIICECKNYKEDPKNPELDQLAMRLSPKRGKLGILVCRKVEDWRKMDKHCKDRANDEHGYIIVLDDEDLITLLEYKKNFEEDKIDDFLTDKYKKTLL